MNTFEGRKHNGWIAKNEDGTIVYFSGHMMPIRIESGHNAQMVGTIGLVDEIKQGCGFWVNNPKDNSSRKIGHITSFDIPGLDWKDEPRSISYFTTFVIE